MIVTLLIVAFVLGYAMIALEHPLKIDKAAAAILTGVVCWILIVIGQESLLGAGHDGASINETLLHHVGEIAEILFFLLAAMTIVELIDAHHGFDAVTDRITTTSRVKLLWVLTVVTFFFSALLDNLTTSIVMATLLRKLIRDQKDVWYYAGMVVIAANAGGAWSPIGDVTTIMLWIGERITALSIITSLLIPSMVCLLIPLVLSSFLLKGNLERPVMEHKSSTDHHLTMSEKNAVLVMGVGGLLFVPFFKQITHLPPFMGMLFSLGLLWVATEIMHRDKSAQYRHALSVASVIRRIDTPSILFFLGILLAVSGLQTAGILESIARTMDKTLGNIYTVNTIIGLLSALVDNVPLVAGAMGMYPLTTYEADHAFWELLAYCAGTGGSTLIIGSAAGVAIMGILKIDFLWYLQRMSLLALSGYLSGIFTYWLLN